MRTFPGAPCCGTIPDTPLVSCEALAFAILSFDLSQVMDALSLPASSLCGCLTRSPCSLPLHNTYEISFLIFTSCAAIMSTQADWSKFSNQPAVTQPTVLSAPLPRLRFHVGKRVICQYGQAGWVGGTIMAHHYSEEGGNASWPKGQVAPYQVVRSLDTPHNTLATPNAQPCLRSWRVNLPSLHRPSRDRRSWTSPRRACPRVRTRAWPSTASR